MKSKVVAIIDGKLRWVDFVTDISGKNAYEERFVFIGVGFYYSVDNVLQESNRLYYFYVRKENVDRYSWEHQQPALL
jgi:hypothetical protein